MVGFARIKRFYDKGLWTLAQVKVAVVVGEITVEQFKEITGEVYVA